MIAFGFGNRLNTVDGKGEKIIGYLWQYYGNGFTFLPAQAAGIRVGHIIQPGGQLQYFLFGFITDLITITQGL